MSESSDERLALAHQALLECTEMFRAIRAASENGGDYLTLADIGEKLAYAAANALDGTG
ncbi:MAG: hypothetical protein KF822_12655 [Steroidobacteraceae bacterium]|nr:hypothetical protein [Steroidobacteraceae bacterium]